MEFVRLLTFKSQLSSITPSDSVLILFSGGVFVSINYLWQEEEFELG